MKIKHQCGLTAFLPDDFSEYLVIKCPDCREEFEIDRSLAAQSTGENQKACPGCKATHDQEVVFCLECGYDYEDSRIVKIKVIRTSKKPDPPLQDNQHDSSLRWGAVVKGAVVGGITSFIASFIEGMVAPIFFMSGLPHSQEEAEAMEKTMVEIVTTSQSFLLIDLVVSLFCMAIGGYVAARSAGRSGIKHGGVTGVLLMFYLGVTFLVSSSPIPEWYTALIFILTIPSAALGGMLHKGDNV